MHVNFGVHNDCDATAVNKHAHAMERQNERSKEKVVEEDGEESREETDIVEEEAAASEERHNDSDHFP